MKIIKTKLTALAMLGMTLVLTGCSYNLKPEGEAFVKANNPQAALKIIFDNLQPSGPADGICSDVSNLKNPPKNKLLKVDGQGFEYLGKELFDCNTTSTTIGNSIHYTTRCKVKPKVFRVNFTDISKANVIETFSVRCKAAKGATTIAMVAKSENKTLPFDVNVEDGKVDMFLAALKTMNRKITLGKAY